MLAKVTLAEGTNEIKLCLLDLYCILVDRFHFVQCWIIVWTTWECKCHLTMSMSSL